MFSMVSYWHLRVAFLIASSLSFCLNTWGSLHQNSIPFSWAHSHVLVRVYLKGVLAHVSWWALSLGILVSAVSEDWGVAAQNRLPLFRIFWEGLYGPAHSPSPPPLPVGITAVYWEVCRVEAGKGWEVSDSCVCPWVLVGGSESSTIGWEDPVAQLPASRRQPWQVPKHTPLSAGGYVCWHSDFQHSRSINSQVTW